jgi:hypothetical protein
MKYLKRSVLFLMMAFCALMGSELQAQDFTKIMGTVIDKKTKQPIPFVNVYFKASGIQTATDFEGRYSLETKTPSDTLIGQYMGYKTSKLPVIKNKFQYLDFELEPLSYELAEVIILPGVNPAEILLKKVIIHKPENNKEEYDAYEYEAYTKIQIDANNFTEKLKDRGIMKPFRFIFENVDTSIINGKAYLPVFFTETMSDVYYRKDPKVCHEVIKANKISGMDNASMGQLLGNSYMKVNLYDNYMVFFEKNFVSPIANFGLAYYKYYLTDSAFIDNRWCYRLNFKPRRNQELTFTGSLWIADTTFALKIVDMRMVGDANINLINEIVINQEFQRVDGLHYMPVIDKLVADVNVAENLKTFGFYIHRGSSFRNILVNNIRSEEFYKAPLDIEVLDSATKKDNNYWAMARHDSLSPEQKNIYKLVDTIQTIRAFKWYKGIANLLVTGYQPIGLVEWGPWLSTYSFNKLEGSRIRIGGRTSNKFSTMMMIDAHIAYGTKDKVFKGGVDFWYRFKKNPNSGFGMSYIYDIEQLGDGQKAFVADNLFGSIIRRNPKNKLTMVEETKGFYDQEWFYGLTTRLYVTHRVIWPMSSSSFDYVDNGRIMTKPYITTSEVKLNAHFAYHEKILTGEFERISLGTRYPVIDIGYAYGAKGLWNGDYKYHRLQVNVEQWFNVGTIGWSKYIIEAGKIWGTLPYSLLKLHEGNETYSFDQRAANTMNYYEFVSDEYISLFYTHHFDGLLFNKIPLLKKLHWREVIHGRCIMGSMSKANKEYNILPEHTYTLTKPFYEVGVGIENIFTVFRIDALWRLSYLDHPNISKFQLMFSFYFSF